jgi:hypothetical protein
MDPEVRFKEWFEKYVEEGGTLRPPSQTLMLRAFRAGWEWRKSVEIDVADHYRMTHRVSPSDPWCLDHGQPAATCTDCRAQANVDREIVSLDIPEKCAEYNKRLREHMEVNGISADEMLTVIAEILITSSDRNAIDELMSHLDRKQLTLEEKLALLNKNFTDAERYQLVIEWMREKGHIGEFADVMDEQGRI